MSDQGVAVGQLRAFVERVERLEEEIKTLNDDKSEVYKEMRGAGFDVKAVRKVVAKRKLDDTVRQNQDATFDLYWDALTGASRVHVHEAGNFYAAQKGIDPKLAHTIVTGMQTETGRAALIAAVDIMIEREEHIAPETGEIHERPSTNDKSSPEAGPQAEASLAGTGAGTLADREGRHEGEAVSADLPTNSPETANEMDRTAEGSLETGSVVAENARKAVPAAGSTLQEDGSVSHAGAGEIPAADERNVEATVEQRSSATNSEISPDPSPSTVADGQPQPSSSPGSAKCDGLPSVVGQGRVSGVNHTGNEEEQAVTQFEPPAFIRKASILRPDCLNPDQCGGHGSHQCYACTKAAREVAA